MIFSPCIDLYNYFGEYSFADDPKQGITLRYPGDAVSGWVTITSTVGITMKELCAETNASKQESSWKMTFEREFKHGRIVGVYRSLISNLERIPEIRDYADIIQSIKFRKYDTEFTADISNRDGKKVQSIQINLKK